MCNYPQFLKQTRTLLAGSYFSAIFHRYFFLSSKGIGATVLLSVLLFRQQSCETRPRRVLQRETRLAAGRGLNKSHNLDARPVLPCQLHSLHRSRNPRQSIRHFSPACWTVTARDRNFSECQRRRHAGSDRPFSVPPPLLLSPLSLSLVRSLSLSLFPSVSLLLSPRLRHLSPFRYSSARVTIT